MGCPNSDQTQVPNLVEEEVEDGVETLSLCDLPLYGNDDDAAVKCDGGRSSTSSEEEHDQKSFEFSSQELCSAPMQESEKKIVFCGRIIHFMERPPPTLCIVKSPGKDFPKKKNGNTTTRSRKINRRRLFRWKLRLFRKPGTSYRKMKAEDEDNSDVSGWKQQQQGRPRRTYSRGWSGKWYFFVFGSARFPVEMGLQDIKSRQSRRSNPSNLFGLSDYAEAEVGDEERARSRRNSWGLLNILRCSNSGNGHDCSHRNDVVKVSNGCFPIR